MLHIIGSLRWHSGVVSTSRAPGTPISAEGACGADSSRAGEAAPAPSAAVAQVAEKSRLPGTRREPARMQEAGVGARALDRRHSVALVERLSGTTPEPSCTSRQCVEALKRPFSAR